MLNWRKQQKLAYKEWSLYYESRHFLSRNEPTFKELIQYCIPKDGSNAKIFSNKSWEYGFINYDFIINNKGNISECYFNFAMNNLNNIWYFLEALAATNTNCYFFCKEEGPLTFFYTEPLGDGLIRFIHISNRQSSFSGLSNKNFRICQDFSIKKYDFIKRFYTCIKTPIENTDIKELNSIGVEEYEKIIKDSKIINKYLESKINKRAYQLIS